MGKDKRAFTESLKANFDLLMSAENQIELLKGFSVQIATLVNNLRAAEEMEMCLYAQDEKDRQMTKLYGINEEAGSGDVKAATPIQVNNNCLQCSGNAMFIKKAFKLACLSYGSTKVTYNNQKYDREELLIIRDTLLQSGGDINI